MTGALRCLLLFTWQQMGVDMRVIEIDRWDAGDVREVFHAATNRAQAARDAADGLATLPGFETWGGFAADAAREAIGRTRQDLDAHGNEALAVANAARSAATNIERIKSDLAILRADAERLGMVIDPFADAVRPGPALRNLLEAELKLVQLQPRLNTIVAEANLVDFALAKVIQMASGSTPVPASPHSNDPNVQRALNGPLPDDPARFRNLWETLSNEDRDLLYDRDHNIGNHPGMPAGDPEHRGSDYYNRLSLADQLQRADTRILPDLQAIDRALNNNPESRLLLLDTQSGDQVHAAIAVGDPDTADHISVTAPGLNTTVRGAMETMTREASLLRGEALRQLRNAPGRNGETVSAIAWIGYDTPQMPGADDLGETLAGGWDVAREGLARAGARDLARFYDGLQAAHQGGPADLTAIGHSYGSLTTGLALQQPGDHGVSRALFYGSPGIEAGTPAQLHLQPGQVFTMATPDDFIQGLYAAKAISPGLSPIAGSFLAETLGDFGPNPATNPEFTRLATGPAVVPDGHGGSLALQEAHGHSDYPRFPDVGGIRTTNYNIAAVLSDLRPVAEK